MEVNEQYVLSYQAHVLLQLLTTHLPWTYTVSFRKALIFVIINIQLGNLIYHCILNMKSITPKSYVQYQVMYGDYTTKNI